MEGKRVRKLKLGSAWHPERIERWLEDHAARGLHLESVAPFGIYTFRADLPEPYDYRIDLATTSEIEDPRYHEAPVKAGWTLAGNSMSWMLWRAPKGEARDIFTHGPARAATYRRRALALLFVGLCQLPTLVSGFMALRRQGELGWAVALALSSALLSLSVYATARAAARWREAKAKSPS